MFDHANCFFVDTIESPTDSDPVPPSKKITVPEYGAFSKVHVPVIGSFLAGVLVDTGTSVGTGVLPDPAGETNVVSGVGV